jgi:serine/threonine-protein kinase
MMKKMAAFGAALSMMAVPALAMADSYGAISYSPTTKSYGWSHDYNSQREAENAANEACYDRADDCQVAVWFRDACGAVAAGDRGWGADWGNNKRQARRKALSQCEEVSGNCQIIHAQCSPNE